MEQQEQTLQYFKSNAQAWQSNAINNNYSLVQNRHNAVISVIDNSENVTALLDVGCGTGQLVIQTAQRGIQSHGIDFAEEMIAVCKKNQGIANTNAQFECASFFDAHLEEKYYDIISAQGFIEYITLPQLDLFFSKCFSALKNGGSLVVGSRNRLFNLHSMNEFTKLEVQHGTILNLLSEASILHTSATQEEAITALSMLERIDPQLNSHPNTGDLTVDTRYQFSPADLIYRAKHHGFEPKMIFPVHFHAFPINSIAENNLKNLHNWIAKIFSEEKICDHRLVPFSSSFVLQLLKP